MVSTGRFSSSQFHDRYSQILTSSNALSGPYCTGGDCSSELCGKLNAAIILIAHRVYRAMGVRRGAVDCTDGFVTATATVTVTASSGQVS